ncbi:2-dehydropantoate 2-reductase [Thalassotalea sp. G2M2-11]|uniref:ketopantoate reductase family protein n=1 Tax=Thalassotalea sp. G2M2-11 TaxID=2787627 RepID=UPI0019D03B66|nr:2-dehydropantoate 2-reductase [Thalassotalea sp. G2M2-11]
MHFLIVGSGAVGGYFGARLAQSGEQVTFIARNQQLQAMKTRGLVVKSINGDVTLKNPQVVEHYEQDATVDVILIAVKTFQLDQALVQIKPVVKPQTRIIPLLNGVDATQRIIDFGIHPQQVYGGVAKIISQLTEPGVITHSGAEPHVTLGLLAHQQQSEQDLQREGELLEKIAQCFVKAKVSIGITQNIEQALWRKFIFVAAWGALASAKSLSVGELRSGKHRHELISIIEEYAQIAQAKDVTITSKLIMQTIQFIDALPEASQTSMQRDIANGQSSEFDSLVRYPYQLAEQQQLNTPVLDNCYQFLQTMLKT